MSLSYVEASSRTYVNTFNPTPTFTHTCSHAQVLALDRIEASYISSDYNLGCGRGMVPLPQEGGALPQEGEEGPQPSI